MFWTTWAVTGEMTKATKANYAPCGGMTKAQRVWLDVAVFALPLVIVGVTLLGRLLC